RAMDLTALKGHDELTDDSKGRRLRSRNRYSLGMNMNCSPYTCVPSLRIVIIGRKLEDLLDDPVNRNECHLQLCSSIEVAKKVTTTDAFMPFNDSTYCHVLGTHQRCVSVVYGSFGKATPSSKHAGYGHYDGKWVDRQGE
ncbi:hypothetical protein Tco_0802741, partial [Tanacetum coccineum]